MPRGPKGEKRPADVIGAAVMIGRIATGEIENDAKEARQEGASSWARKAGMKGGKARAPKLSPARKRQIAKVAAQRPLGQGQGWLIKS